MKKNTALLPALVTALCAVLILAVSAVALYAVDAAILKTGGDISESEPVASDGIDAARNDSIDPWPTSESNAFYGYKSDLPQFILNLLNAVRLEPSEELLKLIYSGMPYYYNDTACINGMEVNGKNIYLVYTSGEYGGGCTFCALSGGEGSPAEAAELIKSKLSSNMLSVAEAEAIKEFVNLFAEVGLIEYEWLDSAVYGGGFSSIADYVCGTESIVGIAQNGVVTVRFTEAPRLVLLADPATGCICGISVSIYKYGSEEKP